MNLKIHTHNNKQIAELVSMSTVITGELDAVDLLGNAYNQGAIGIIIQEKHLCREFFDLSTRIAGAILQKFSNYQMKLAIVGDFKKYNSKSLNDFIYESNKSRHVIFTASIEEALNILSV